MEVQQSIREYKTMRVGADSEYSSELTKNYGEVTEITLGQRDLNTLRQNNCLVHESPFGGYIVMFERNYYRDVDPYSDNTIIDELKEFDEMEAILSVSITRLFEEYGSWSDPYDNREMPIVVELQDLVI